MAIPQRSSYESSSKKKPLEIEKKLLKKKPTIPTCNKIEKEEIDNDKNPTLCYAKKMEKSSAAPGVYGKAKTSASGSASAMDRAIEVQEKLPPEFPSCVKLMLRSHVTGGFWLSLPKQFCDLHLPKHDDIVVLVDENDEEYKTKYLIGKNGLSGGWRGFSIAHNLLEGDVIVFQSIKPCRIKVYIVRANSLSEIDGAISLLSLDFQAKPIDYEDVKKVSIVEQKIMESYTNNGRQEATTSNALLAVKSEDMPMLDAPRDIVPAQNHQSEDESDEFGSEVLDGIRFSESVIDFKEVKNFESFSILVDGLVIDSEIPKHLQTKYYELCCSQNTFLHDHLFKGLNCKLVAGVISETVNIADAIRASNLNTSRDYLQTWDKTLKAFEDMGMAVGFLRDRIQKLVCLQHEEQEIIKSKTFERDQLEMEKKKFEAELFRVKQELKTLDAEIETLKVKNKKIVQTFKEMATAPW